MTYDQIVAPGNAPFSVPVIPTGMNRPLLAGEASDLNVKFPVPPYGNTYTGDGLPVVP